MDEELLELQRQFEFAQQAKLSVRLSEPNVVELVQKLQQLGIIDFDLLHTASGKEYITPKQAQHIVAIHSTFVLINGEIISSYRDTVAGEINERPQECGQTALAEISAQLQLGSELVVSILEPRLGTLVKVRLECGQLYTPAYVARVTAMARGAARGVFVPMNLSALWNSLQGLLQGMDGASGVAVEGFFFCTLFYGLVMEGEILGSLRAGVQWTPTSHDEVSVFAKAQKKCVDSFFSQLYEKALDLFEDDQTTSVSFCPFTQTFTANPSYLGGGHLILDLDIHNKLKSGIEVDESPMGESVSLGPGDRVALAKSFPRPLSVKGIAPVEALEAKRVETFMSALGVITEESGLMLKKLHNKLERTILHANRKDSTSQISTETDPLSLLPKVVSLLYVQIHGKALQEGAISVAVLRLLEDDCTADRIQSKRGLLEENFDACIEKLV